MSRGWHMAGWRCLVGVALYRFSYRLQGGADRIDPPSRHFVRSNPWWDNWKENNPEKVAEYLR